MSVISYSFIFISSCMSAISYSSALNSVLIFSRFPYLQLIISDVRLSIIKFLSSLFSNFSKSTYKLLSPDIVFIYWLINIWILKLKCIFWSERYFLWTKLYLLSLYDIFIIGTHGKATRQSIYGVWWYLLISKKYHSNYCNDVSKANENFCNGCN
jgi:hypothetical protein